ncbi:MAG: YjjG family noncanonical pyrimidine nucleotidase [Firmicutes bacterium]|nr:YjjG family noncanonical pyrimidine nucleotidase [Bacillota bacterium]
MNKKYDVFLFDLDGTLFDTQLSTVVSLKEMAKRYGFVYDESVWQRYMEINIEAWKSYEKGEMSVDELFSKRISRLLDSFNIQNCENGFNAKDVVEFIDYTHLINGAEKMCKKITSKGKLIYIVTNGIQEIQVSRINNSTIKNYITDMYATDRVGFSKPNEKFFDYVLEKIPQINKDKILIIGNSLTSDIQGGINAGIDTCWLNLSNEKNKSAIIPTYEINKLIDLERFV